ncbi:hypothetical protein HPB49_009605 [Dermacentor silvarum]|uniref:Uncharacterized protein n=1 Tax=Dermacentor silvarum TaxID=543639 RepID=A0ACB8DYT6_DERSI|nr:hypothetical protein HPB49_009605 [Dermacentor silvarum]
MAASVVGEDLPPELFTADLGWQTAVVRRAANKDTRARSLVTKMESVRPKAEVSAGVRQSGDRVNRQLIKAGRMPPLPKEDAKILIRPKGGLAVARFASGAEEEEDVSGSRGPGLGIAILWASQPVPIESAKALQNSGVLQMCQRKGVKDRWPEGHQVGRPRLIGEVTWLSGAPPLRQPYPTPTGSLFFKLFLYPRIGPSRDPLWSRVVAVGWGYDMRTGGLYSKLQLGRQDRPITGPTMELTWYRVIIRDGGRPLGLPHSSSFTRSSPGLQQRALMGPVV